MDSGLYQAEKIVGDGNLDFEKYKLKNYRSINQSEEDDSGAH